MGKVLKILHIKDLLDKVVDLDLEGCGFVLTFPDEVLAREYNGIGPEFLNPNIRAKVTSWFHIFEPAALIHDMRNYLSDGERLNFEKANKEFLDNCLKIADSTYPLWRLSRRKLARLVARLLYEFVQSDFGWRAWLDCYKKTLSNKNQTPIKEN
ncbi:MAG: hypothetical protein IJQ34_02185 [Kiritimatiellae bacterium]|nr:hypothetical protein [Kiritimatiellia bacterium]